jgi:CheY-like chemotaxis protein
LVVDDDPGIREALEGLLADQGYGVTLAANGKQALQVCRSPPLPGLIFLDLQMPVMDGIEFLRLREVDAELSQVPVCVMSAFQISPSISTSATAVLRKPLRAADLVAVAKRFLESV